MLPNSFKLGSITTSAAKTNTAHYPSGLGSLLRARAAIRCQHSDNSTSRHIQDTSARKQALFPRFYPRPTVTAKLIAPPHFTLKPTEPKQYLTYLTPTGQATRAWRIASTFSGPSPSHWLSWGTQACASSQSPRRTHSQKNPKSRSRETASSFPKECIFPGRAGDLGQGDTREGSCREGALGHHPRLLLRTDSAPGAGTGGEPRPGCRGLLPTGAGGGKAPTGTAGRQPCPRRPGEPGPRDAPAALPTAARAPASAARSAAHPPAASPSSARSGPAAPGARPGAVRVTWRGRRRPARRRWALLHRPDNASPRRRHLGRRLSWPRRRAGTRADARPLAELEQNVNKPPFSSGAPDAASAAPAAQAPPSPLTTPVSAHRHAPRPPPTARQLRPVLGPPVVLIGFRPKLRPLARRGTAPVQRLSAGCCWPRHRRAPWAGVARGGSVRRLSVGRLRGRILYTAIYTERERGVSYRGIYIRVCVCVCIYPGTCV